MIAAPVVVMLFLVDIVMMIVEKKPKNKKIQELFNV